jgi:hypothetical protein
MTNQHIIPLDNLVNEPILKETQLHKRTPPEGAGNTNRGLTSQAEADSMEAMQNPISALPSRQLLSSAVDDFCVRDVEYCAPSEDVIDEFTWGVCRKLGEDLSTEFFTVETRQGFRQFLNVLINIEVKRANRSA